MLRKFFSAEHVLALLLVFVPIAITAEYILHSDQMFVFVTSAIAIIPLAGLMGRATEHLSEHVGEGLGGILNAAFGNAAELIIAITALRAGYHDLVKASITGSIIGNILLVFGLSALAGGIKFPRQTFNRTAAHLGATMLLLSGIALVIPAVFHSIAGERAEIDEQTMSLLISVILIVTYGLSILFTLKTHSHLYRGNSGETSADGSSRPGLWSKSKSLTVLIMAAAVVALMSEMLVGSVEVAAETLGMTEVFIGVILVAIIGNAAEHSTAVLMAMRNKMDLALNIAVGSSLQIALFVAPLLVFLSYVIGPTPMDLRFTSMEVLAVAVSVGIMAMMSEDGETHWMEGVQLLAVYGILAIAFFFLPA